MSNQDWRPGHLTLSATHVIANEIQNYSVFTDGGGYDARSRENILRPSAAKASLKQRIPIEIDYQQKLTNLPHQVQMEITNNGATGSATHLPTDPTNIAYDKSIIDRLIQLKTQFLQNSRIEANSFYGSDPHNKSEQEYIDTFNSYIQQDLRPGETYRHWVQSYSAGYTAKLYSESIRLLNERSHQLNAAYMNALARQEAERQAQVAAQTAKAKAESERQAHAAAQAAKAKAEAERRAHATAQAAKAKAEAERQAHAAAQAAKAKAEAERQAHAAAQAAKAKAEAEHAARVAAQIAQAEHEAREEALWQAELKEDKEKARKREAAKQAKKRRKQKVASDVAAEFDSMLHQFTQNRPEDIDEKLRWMEDRYQELYAANLAVTKAEREVDAFFYLIGESGKRWRALNNAQDEIRTLIRLKHRIEKVQIPSVSIAITAGRPLLITADGLIAEFEGSPLSFAKSLDTLKGLRAALTSGPIGVFLASAFYTPTLGNGELQRNPVVLTIPLSQFYPEREYSPFGRPAIRHWLPHRVVSSVRGEHTQLYLESTGYGVRARQVILNPKTKLYTFTTEGLVPITLTWTPDSPPGGDVSSSTDLPAIDSDIKIYPGARVTQIEGRADEHPACDFDDPDDYILEFPIESGIESIYMMATRGDPRYEPGTATGKGKIVGKNWLGRATKVRGAPIPAQVADQLRGQDFRNFDRFREAFWRAVGADSELVKQFNKADQKLLLNGAAPSVDEIDFAGQRDKYEIHHKKYIKDGGAVYDFDNLSIMTPKSHINLHKPGKQP